MNTEKIDGEVNPHDVDVEGNWISPDGEAIELENLRFETPDGEKVWPIAVTNKSELFPSCLFCDKETAENFVVLLENNQYIYLSRCCRQVAFCEVKGEVT